MKMKRKHTSAALILMYAMKQKAKRPTSQSRH